MMNLGSLQRKSVENNKNKNQRNRIEEVVLPALLPGFDVRPFSLALRRTEYRAALVLSGDVIAAIHREGEVVSTRDEDGCLHVLARLSDASAGRLAEFIVSP